MGLKFSNYMYIPTYVRIQAYAGICIHMYIQIIFIGVSLVLDQGQGSLFGLDSHEN